MVLTRIITRITYLAFIKGSMLLHMYRWSPAFALVLDAGRARKNTTRTPNARRPPGDVPVGKVAWTSPSSLLQERPARTRVSVCLSETSLRKWQCRMTLRPSSGREANLPIFPSRIVFIFVRRSSSCASRRNPAAHSLTGWFGTLGNRKNRQH